MREIVLDTETTGLDPFSGHRIVEIGCVEIFNKVATGKTFHAYINPQRDMPEEAYRVHGLSFDFLKDQPTFDEVQKDFLDFLEEDPLVIHNAPFDMKFINYELDQIQVPSIGETRVIDTLQMARSKFPGGQASLDALCRRFKIDNSVRTKHGALLDAELLALVYLELCGGDQPDLVMPSTDDEGDEDIVHVDRSFRPSRNYAVKKDELEAHRNFLNGLSDPLWLAGGE